MYSRGEKSHPQTHTLIFFINGHINGNNYGDNERLDLEFDPSFKKGL